MTRAVDCLQPKMMLCRPHCKLAIRRNLNVCAIFPLAAHIAKQPWFAILYVCRPDLLFGFLKIAGGIGHMTFPRDLRPSRVYHSLAIGSEAQAENLLAVVALVVGHLAGLKPGSICHPDIAFPFQIKDPGNAVSAGCRC